MRRALACFARLSTASPQARVYRPWPRVLRCRQQWPLKTCRQQVSSYTTTARNAKHVTSKKRRAIVARIQVDDPTSWLKALDKFLPPRLRYQDVGQKQETPDLAEISVIFRKLQYEAGVDLWLWMVQHGYRKAVVCLMDSLLKDVASRIRRDRDSHPSNIVWPDSLFAKLDAGQVPELSLPAGGSPVSLNQTSDPGSTTTAEDRHFLNSVWSSLAQFVLHAANNTDQQGQDCMSATMLILGILHNLEMVPDDIYAYQRLNLSSYAQKPPILHLVSSRILTSISDAAWREQQDDAIIQATELGVSLREISQSVPGGRFRLKVRPLPPEIWLEYILWCCLDRDHAGAAVKTINTMREQSNPWFAIRWCSALPNNDSNQLVDWRRERLRHGGSVGLIEGYSREKPFVDVPSRTISVEVVLATIEKLLISWDSDKHGLPDVTSLQRTLSGIENMISFLEPYDLPSSYFDYLESRLMHVGMFGTTLAPTLLQEWSSRVASMRKFESINRPKVTRQDLQYDSILDHGLLQSGVQHQVLGALVQTGAVHDALAVFNDIQELVDRNKVRSITEFLYEQPTSEKSFFSPRPDEYRLEYSDSHGQLPYYKLAGFLNLVSETNLAGLGDWLLYADEIDGALIPEAAYGFSSMVPALLKFASITQNKSLLGKVLKASRSDRKPTIRVLRAVFDADVAMLNLRGAQNDLRGLKHVQGGGVGVSNVVQLAATILRLESGLIGLERPQTAQLSDATFIMNGILNGYYDSTRSDYRTTQRTLFKQQVAHILRIFAYCQWSCLGRFAKKYIHHFAAGNQASLPVKHFNVILSAVADVRGSKEARQMWEHFCQEVEHQSRTDAAQAENFDFRSAGDILDTSFITPESSDSAEPVISAKAKDISASTGVQPHMAESKESGEFINPFFASSVENDLHEETVNEPADGSINLDPFAFDEIKPELSERSRPQLEMMLEPLHATKPNLSTLRIIVRAAVTEKEKRQAQHLGTSVQDDIIKWSLNKFELLGTTAANIVSQEIRQPVSELDISLPHSETQRVSSKPSGQAQQLQNTTSLLWSSGRQQKLRPNEAVDTAYAAEDQDATRRIEGN